MRGGALGSKDHLDAGTLCADHSQALAPQHTGWGRVPEWPHPASYPPSKLVGHTQAKGGQ